MAVAITFGIRQQIVELRTQNKSYRQISQELGVSYDTVRRICKRQEKEGEAGLTPYYNCCGQSGIRLSKFYHRVSLWLKRAHPCWGAPYIRLQLANRYPIAELPSVRTLQLWFKAANLSRTQDAILWQVRLVVSY